MFTLVGLGLYYAKDISLKGIEECKNADFVYLENYTSKIMGSTKEDIEKIIGKSIKELTREDIEQSLGFLEQAKEKDVVVLVGGDPLVATTHSDLILRAKEEGINVRIIHNSSIYSAIAETGLQIYKFGKTATVTYWEKNFEPTSFYDTIKENSERGLHTLLLLDIKIPEERFMTANEAMKLLLDIEKKKNQRIFTKDTEIVVFARAGSEDSLIKFGKVDDMIKEDFGAPMHVLIIPGKLHEIELEYLESL